MKLFSSRQFSLCIAAFSALVFGVTSCKTTANFTRSSVVPAAEGYTRLKHDKNHNYTLYVHVKHLAGPNRLTPPRKTYVVWLQTEKNGTTNVGRLDVGSDLEGSLNTVTAFKPVKVFITAEDNANIAVPTGETILNSTSF